MGVHRGAHDICDFWSTRAWLAVRYLIWGWAFYVVIPPSHNCLAAGIGNRAFDSVMWPKPRQMYVQGGGLGLLFFIIRGVRPGSG